MPPSCRTPSRATHLFEGHLVQFAFLQGQINIFQLALLVDREAFAGKLLDLVVERRDLFDDLVELLGRFRGPLLDVLRFRRLLIQSRSQVVQRVLLLFDGLPKRLDIPFDSGSLVLQFCQLFLFGSDRFGDGLQSFREALQLLRFEGLSGWASASRRNSQAGASCRCSVTPLLTDWSISLVGYRSEFWLPLPPGHLSDSCLRTLECRGRQCLCRIQQRSHPRLPDLLLAAHRPLWLPLQWSR